MTPPVPTAAEAARRCWVCSIRHFIKHRQAYAEGSVATCLLCILGSAVDAGLLPSWTSWVSPVVVLSGRFFTD